MIDLVVVGGGPAGLMTAIHARLAGLEVVVLERRPSSPDKACGEGLMPEALRRLRAVGVDPDGVALRGIRYVGRGTEATARFSAGEGRGVRRTALRAALQQRADELGVRVLERHVGSVVLEGSHVTVSDVEARYLVAADGLHSGVRTRLGLARGSGGPRRFGVRQHFRVAPWTDLVEVHWSDQVELYVTPVARDVVGVAVLGPRPLSLADALRAVPELGERIGAAAPASQTRGAGPLLQRTSARVRGRVLLVGDAAGYVDALTGEGLRLGFAQADAAVAAVVGDDPASYERAWRTITRPYRVLTHGLLLAASGRTTRSFIVPAAAAAPWAFGRAVDALAG